jgi:cytochrome c-type biogenesis protein CcmE
VKKSTTYIIGILVILAFLGLAYGGLKRSMTPYVSFKEAKSTKSKVQVKGELVKGRTQYDGKTGDLVFYLRDDARTEMKVLYAGSKPGNFDQASQAVVVGKYEGTVFRAERVLVKCPSKYQGETAGSERGQPK